jgi:hypothetical protein
MTDATSADLTTDLRNNAFDEIERVANKAASFSRSISEAAYRGDDLTMLVHLKQLRLCVIEMIKIYKDYFDGQDVGTAEPERSHRQDQRSGNAVARGRPQRPAGVLPA